MLVFHGDSSKKTDLLRWNTRIEGFTTHEFIKDQRDVERKNHPTNHITYLSMLSVCTGTGTLDVGKWLHSHFNGSILV